MTTSHWLRGGHDGTWNINAAFTPTSLVIPAGATLKRFQVNEFVIEGITTSGAYNGVSPLHCTYSIMVTAGQYNGRRLFSTSRRVPVEFTAIAAGIPVTQAYFAYVSAGDNELGCDQPCSYGTAAGPGFTITMTLGVFGVSGAGGGMSGHVQYTFAALYLTTP